LDSIKHKVKGVIAGTDLIRKLPSQGNGPVDEDNVHIRLKEQYFSFWRPKEDLKPKLWETKQHIDLAELPQKKIDK